MSSVLAGLMVGVALVSAPHHATKHHHHKPRRPITMYEGPVYGWRNEWSPFIPAKVHTHPDPKCGFCQKASYSPAPPNTSPDPDLTPGATRDLSADQVCATRWGKDERHVTAKMKADVFAAYGFTGYHDPRCIPDKHGRSCEIDHLISRELAGADDARNLWPEPYGGQCNAHEKDRLENRLHKEVCSGRLSLLQAQTMIRSDWQAAYRVAFGHGC